MEQQGEEIPLEEERLLQSEKSAKPATTEILAEWIPAHINKRVCHRFTTHTDVQDIDENALCHCGYAHKDHTQSALQNYKVDQRDWGEKYTTFLPTDAFGEMLFRSKGGHTSKFVRLDCSNNLDAVLTLLTEKWGLGIPNLVISLVGGARQFHVRPSVHHLFKTGLMDAAEKTGAWILTNGTHDGIVRQLGEVLRDYTEIHDGVKNPIAAIGIAGWGTLSNRESLVGQAGQWPVDYYEEVSVTRRTQFIDPNHTHFLFIDDGTQHKFSVEFSFRTRLESYMQRKTKSKIEGGRWTLEAVRNSVRNEVPVVIVQGSGRIADILAYAYQNAEEVEAEADDEDGKKKINRKKMALPPSISQDVHEMMRAALGNNKVAEKVKMVVECLETPDYITVFSLEGDAAKLDEAILHAVMKGRKGKKINRLRLALAWNRPDLATKEIFSAKAKWRSEELDDMLHTALRCDQAQFVQLFRDNNVSIKDFLTCKRLLQLYNESRTHFSLADVGSLIKDLMGQFYEPQYRQRFYQRMDVDIIVEAEDEEKKDVELNLEGDTAGDEYFDGLALLTSEMRSEANGDGETSRLSIRYPGTVKFDEPERELFLWAVLLNRLEMATLFWRGLKDGIAAALTAQGLLNAVSQRVTDSQLRTRLEDNSRYFAELAVGVLNRCYREDDIKTYMLLTCVQPNYGNCTNMSLAVHTDNKTFIAHASCQTLLTRIWTARVGDCHKPPWSTQLRHTSDSGASESSTELKEEKCSRAKGALSKLWKVTHTPVTVFALNLIFYVAFLALFSVVLLTDFTETVSIKEMVVYIWAITIYMEEIRELLYAGHKDAKFRSHLQAYLKDQWNYIDLLTMILLLCGVILRLLPGCAKCLNAARVVLAVDFIFLIVRILDIFLIHKELGPKVVMIRRMLKDLVYFFLIMLVFIVAYGVAAQVMLYPNSSMSLTLCKDVLRRAYWQMFGELLLEEVEGTESCTSDPALVTEDLPICPAESGTNVLPVVLAIYVLVTNVLMLNLLIAMFSDTFAKVHNETDLFWYFQRYYIICKYYERPPLPPPLIVISYIYSITLYCIRRQKKGAEESSLDTNFRRTLREDEKRKLTLFEKYAAEKFLKKEVSEESEQIRQIRETVNVTMETLDRVNRLVEKISSATAESSATATLLEKLAQLEKQHAKTNDNFHWIKLALSEKGISPEK